MNAVTSKDGTRIAYNRSGAGPALVLVGGAFQHRTIDTRTSELAELLAAQFTVYHYDRRGRGESGDTPPYAVEREIEDLGCLIDAADGSAFVFASSSGCNLALRAAANGLAISKLALWEPNFIVNDARPPLPADYVEHLNELVAANRRGDAVEYFMTVAVGIPAEFVAQMRDMPMWPALEAAAHTLANDGTIVAPDMAGVTPSAEDWSAVTVPTLVLDGGTTPWLSDGADGVGAALPSARRRTLPGQTHDVDPGALVPVLVEFYLTP